MNKLPRILLCCLAVPGPLINPELSSRKRKRSNAFRSWEMSTCELIVLHLDFRMYIHSTLIRTQCTLYIHSTLIRTQCTYTVHWSGLTVHTQYTDQDPMYIHSTLIRTQCTYTVHWSGPNVHTQFTDQDPLYIVHTQYTDQDSLYSHGHNQPGYWLSGLKPLKNILREI